MRITTTDFDTIHKDIWIENYLFKVIRNKTHLRHMKPNITTLVSTPTDEEAVNMIYHHHHRYHMRPLSLLSQFLNHIQPTFICIL